MNDYLLLFTLASVPRALCVEKQSTRVHKEEPAEMAQMMHVPRRATLLARKLCQAQIFHAHDGAT